MTSDGATSYILYHDPVSICSVMVRHTFALRGKARDNDAELQVEERICSLKDRENLTEEFLCGVNSKGEVPVLVPAASAQDHTEAIPDSLHITYFFAGRYPSLLPSENADDIKRLMSELHAINYFSLTFTGKPQMQLGNAAFLENKLRTEKAISGRYRSAIEDKIQRIHNRKLAALEPHNVENAIRRSKDFLIEIAELLENSKTGWILNTTRPTALDAHVVVLICRLQDVHRQNLIPDKVQQYGKVAMAQKEWKEVMNGSRTVPPGGF